MSLDEASQGFVLDAPASINTNFYAAIGDNLYGYSALGSAPALGLLGDLDTYALRVDVGMNYSVLTPTDTPFGVGALNANFAILDRYGNVLAISSDYGLYSGFSFTAQDSLYYIQVFTDTPGFYGLRVINNTIVENNVIGEVVQYGSRYSAALDFSSDIDKYSFTGVVGQRLYMVLDTQIPDLYLSVETVDERFVTGLVATGSGVYYFDPPATGLFELNISANNFRSTGAYSFVAKPNSLPTGSVSVTGTVAQGGVVSASGSLADADGLGTFVFQWLLNGSPIGGATGSSFTLTQNEVGGQVSVVVAYIDGLGVYEAVASPIRR
jgi:hypothetical protein